MFFKTDNITMKIYLIRMKNRHIHLEERICFSRGSSIWHFLSFYQIPIEAIILRWKIKSKYSYDNIRQKSTFKINWTLFDSLDDLLTRLSRERKQEDLIRIINNHLA